MVTVVAPKHAGAFSTSPENGVPDDQVKFACAAGAASNIKATKTPTNGSVRRTGPAPTFIVPSPYRGSALAFLRRQRTSGGGDAGATLPQSTSFRAERYCIDPVGNCAPDQSTGYPPGPASSRRSRGRVPDRGSSACGGLTVPLGSVHQKQMRSDHVVGDLVAHLRSDDRRGAEVDATPHPRVLDLRDRLGEAREASLHGRHRGRGGGERGVIAVERG